MYDYGPGGWSWGYAFMFFGMALFWGLLILSIVLALRYAGRHIPSSPLSPTRAEQLLDERFARGDIDEAEYRERLQILRAAQSP